jgi:hypothetical protein
LQSEREQTSASTSIAVGAGAAIVKVAQYAITAAAGAFSAMAGIPYIGPFLAVAAGAAALAAVLAMGNKIFSARGGFGQVPFDGAITELHKDEMVLPARFATPLRAMLQDSVNWAPANDYSMPSMVAEAASQPDSPMNPMNQGGGDTIIIQAVDGQSVKKLLRRNGRGIVSSLKNQARGFNTGSR